MLCVYLLYVSVRLEGFCWVLLKLSLLLLKRDEDFFLIICCLCNQLLGIILCFGFYMWPQCASWLMQAKMLHMLSNLLDQKEKHAKKTTTCCYYNFSHHIISREKQTFKQFFFFTEKTPSLLQFSLEEVIIAFLFQLFQQNILCH